MSSPNGRTRPRGAAVAAALLAAAALAACGGSDGDGTDTGAAAAGAPCTKAALEEAVRAANPGEEVRVLAHGCEAGWASGAILVGPEDAEGSFEAAFLARDEGGRWAVPSELPCDDESIPEKILERSPCRVS